MLGQLFTIGAHFHGTLSANGVGRFKLPVGATLKEVQFSCAGATAATLDFGTAADPDGIIDGGAVGQSESVAVFDRDDFNGVLYTDADDIEHVHLAEGTVMEWTVIHASAVDADLLFVFIEG